MNVGRSDVKSLTIGLLIYMIIGYQEAQAAQADCLPGVIAEHVGRIQKVKMYKHPRRKCDIWISGKVTILDMMTDQEVNAFIVDSTQCFSRNGQPIECTQLSPIWPVILIREVKHTKSEKEKAFAVMVQQIDSPH